MPRDFPDQTLPRDTIENMRALNRIVTRASGVLNRTVLNSDLSLSEMRVIYELGLQDWAARALAQQLGLDEGYLSRILKRFADRGWLERRPSPEDGRVALLSLTEKGAECLEEFEEIARSNVAESLAAMPMAEQPALDRAIARLRLALGDKTLRLDEVTFRDIEIGDLGWMTQRHGELYRIENAYDQSFEILVAEIIVEFLKTRDPARERAIVPVCNGLPLGSIFCVQGPAPDTAQLRLFGLEPSLRGRGLGRQMMAEWLRFARSAGYKRATLWTHESHAAAGRLYAATGFEITGTEATRNFGQDVVVQQWEMTL
ncbi:GNAT family N-acetyltransferase [Dinoroseobacter sp. S76]|uniref:GNAT family N-acetyltransferase n=1 Tax=Dinoroseobacter sp. S76 TaxID=3415124 RepID=UPI003C79C03F